MTKYTKKIIINIIFFIAIFGITFVVISIIYKSNMIQKSNQLVEQYETIIRLGISAIAASLAPIVQVCNEWKKSRTNNMAGISIFVSNVTTLRENRKNDQPEVVIGSAKWFVYVDVSIVNTGKQNITCLQINETSLKSEVMKIDSEYKFRFRVCRDSEGAFKRYYPFTAGYYDVSGKYHKKKYRLQIDEQNQKAAVD